MTFHAHLANFAQRQPQPPPRAPGLGDRLHTLLRPIVVWMDHHLGTRLAHCAPCARRRAGLNRLGSHLATPFRRLWNPLATRLAALRRRP